MSCEHRVQVGQPKKTQLALPGETADYAFGYPPSGLRAVSGFNS